MCSCFPRLAALLVLALPASAQGTVQLMLSGRVENATGTSIDLELATRGSDGAEAPLVSLHMALLPNTTAIDVAALLEARLGEWKVRHVAPAPASDRMQATLFVDGVSRVLVRVGDGLHASIGLPEGSPASVQLLEPLAKKGKGKFKFHGVTHDPRMRQRGVLDFSVDLEADTAPIEAVELLANACLRTHWLSERPSHETWKPSPSFEGLELVGTSFTLDTTAADWGLELRLQ